MFFPGLHCFDITNIALAAVAPLLNDVTVVYDAALRAVNVSCPAGSTFATLEHTRTIDCDCAMTSADIEAVLAELNKCYG